MVGAANTLRPCTVVGARLPAASWVQRGHASSSHAKWARVHGGHRSCPALAPTNSCCCSPGTVSKGHVSDALPAALHDPRKTPGQWSPGPLVCWKPTSTTSVVGPLARLAPAPLHQTFMYVVFTIPFARWGPGEGSGWSSVRAPKFKNVELTGVAADISAVDIFLRVSHHLAAFPRTCPPPPSVPDGRRSGS